MVDRYHWGDMGMEEDQDGNYVEYSDYAALEAQLAELVRGLKKIAGSHWERVGTCQTDMEDVPDMDAYAAMLEARRILSALEAAPPTPMVSPDLEKQAGESEAGHIERLLIAAGNKPDTPPAPKVTEVAIDEMAYCFWSIRPRDLDEWAKSGPAMPDGYRGGIRAWFFACEIRRALTAAQESGKP